MNPTERDSAILAKVDAEIARLTRFRAQYERRQVVEWWCDDLVDFIDLSAAGYNPISLVDGDWGSEHLESRVYYDIEWDEWPGEEPRAAIADIRVMVSINPLLPAVDITAAVPEDAMSRYRAMACERAEALRKERDLADAQAEKYYARMGI